MNKRRFLLALLLLLTPMVAFADDKDEIRTTVQSFYDEYLKFAMAPGKMSGDKLVAEDKRLSPAFKEAYKSLLKKAKKNGGLDYDPIFNGQDFPDQGYAVDTVSVKGDTAAVALKSRSAGWDKKIQVQVKKIKNQWFINGIEGLVGR